jgi:hypothetical protein
MEAAMPAYVAEPLGTLDQTGTAAAGCRAADDARSRPAARADGSGSCDA